MLIDLSCPVENRGFSVQKNGETGKTYVLLKLLNISEKTITALNFNLKACDKDGVEILSVPVELTELSAPPKSFFAEDKPFYLDGVKNAESISIDVTYAAFEGEEPYTVSDENIIDYDSKEASIDDAMMLRKLVPDAVCFASEKTDHWKCACGRPNFLDSENCVRCGRSKDVMLANFSSKEALNDALNEVQKAIEAEETQKALEAEELRKEKKRKIKKGFLTAGIVIIALALLSVAGYFIRYAVVSFQAGNAVKSGDYVKAYELYTSINSKKSADIVDKAMGNTPSNLVYATGYLAEDSENLYYITRSMYSQPANLIKENKSTKEKTILTDAAYCCLNVTDDYIYFINSESKPCRMTKDGKTTDILLETQTYYICVLGNDMYYIKTDYDNPKGFTQEECEILAAQGQLDTFTRLYKFNLETKKDTLVSTENITTCEIFGDRIYYLTTNDVEDAWAMSNLKSMNMKGEDVKTIVESPVTAFFVKNGALYYISYFDEYAKGSTITDMSSLNCIITRLDLKTGTKTNITTFEDGIVMDLNVSGNKMIYIVYDRNEFLGYYASESYDVPAPTCEVKCYDIETGETKTLLTAEVASLNVCGNEMLGVLNDGTMIRLQLDTLAFEPVYEDGSSTPPITEELSE